MALRHQESKTIVVARFQRLDRCEHTSILRDDVTNATKPDIIELIDHCFEVVNADLSQRYYAELFGSLLALSTSGVVGRGEQLPGRGRVEDCDGEIV